MSPAKGGGGGETVPNRIDSTDNGIVETTVKTTVDLIGEATSELDLQIGSGLEEKDPGLRRRPQHGQIV